MTAAGFVSGTHVVHRRPVPARVAAGASCLLGTLLLVMLPALLDAAVYVAVLASASASAALVGGGVLWVRQSLVAWAVIGIAAATVLGVQLLEVSLGLPGAGGLPRLGIPESSAVLILALAVLALAVRSGLRRRPEVSTDHPYALWP